MFGFFKGCEMTISEKSELPDWKSPIRIICLAKNEKPQNTRRRQGLVALPGIEPGFED
jgi:hypothetical protein